MIDLTELKEIIKKKSLADDDKVFIQLMLDGALRVSEITQKSNIKIIMGNTVILKQQKTGKMKTFTSSVEIPKRFLNSNNYIHEYLYRNRQYWYRLFKKYGIKIINSDKKHDTVTHAIRKLIATEMHVLKNNVTDEAIASVLGHSNTDSVKYYIKEKQNEKPRAKSIFDTFDVTNSPVKVNRKGILSLRK
jgi:site-specific recombinase XerC